MRGDAGSATKVGPRGSAVINNEKSTSEITEDKKGRGEEGVAGEVTILDRCLVK